ncbi:MAG: type II/IV secretion system protein [Deltaproteobacteria bacterium]|nr:type II/IV secretion system protein [Deltaproteobacteria bacterium]
MGGDRRDAVRGGAARARPGRAPRGGGRGRRLGRAPSLPIRAGDTFRAGDPAPVTHLKRLEDLLALLQTRGLLQAGQAQDVRNRGRDQARHVLLDKRAELRRMLGRQRVTYAVSEIELVASFRFHRADRPEALLDEESITRAVAEALSLPFVTLDPLSLDYRLVTESFGGPFAERHLVVALEETDDGLTLAVADPWDRELLDSIERFKGKRVSPVVASKSEILQILVEFHGFRRSMQAAEAEFRSDLPDLGNLEQFYRLKGAHELDASDQPIVQAVWYLLNYALEQRASDIHVEPKREEAWVRMRIDGVLHRIHRLPKAVHAAVVSRIKMLGRLDIAERRLPQDGRFKTSFEGQEVEFRVSVVPTAFGEKVVLRVFDPGVYVRDLGGLGFLPSELLVVERLLAARSGMVLVTGPTGSGKTTTLYSALHHVQNPRINICTLEDPIEIVHEAFNQIAVQHRIGFTFANALKNLLRQDPDVIMVGEIRDPETAENAVQSALTGHLVLSTLHTNDAASGVTRLLDLGVYPFLVASVLQGLVAQRLVRRICPHCAVDEVLTEEQVLALRITGAKDRKLKVRRGVGCAKCRGTGYHGRTGVFEVLPVTPRIARLITERAPAAEIKKEALNDGMLTLRECAIRKMAMGETTFDEVISMTEEQVLY